MQTAEVMLAAEAFVRFPSCNASLARLPVSSFLPSGCPAGDVFLASHAGAHLSIPALSLQSSSHENSSKIEFLARTRYAS